MVKMLKQAPTSLRETAKHSYDVVEELLGTRTPHKGVDNASVASSCGDVEKRSCHHMKPQHGLGDVVIDMGEVTWQPMYPTSGWSEGLVQPLTAQTSINDTEEVETGEREHEASATLGGRRASRLVCNKAAPLHMLVNTSPKLQAIPYTESCQIVRQDSNSSLCLRDAPSFTAPLHSAVSSTDSQAIGTLLIAADGSYDPSSPMVDGATALHRAARHGHFGIVRMLLDAGAEQRCDQLGFSPLHDAAHAGHHEIVRLLLERRAHFTAAEGTTPFDLAVHAGHVHTVSEFLTAGIWPVTHNLAETVRPLQLAALSGRKTLLKLLLARLKSCSNAKHRQDEAHMTLFS